MGLLGGQSTPIESIAGHTGHCSDQCLHRLVLGRQCDLMLRQGRDFSISGASAGQLFGGNCIHLLAQNCERCAGSHRVRRQRCCKLVGIMDQACVLLDYEAKFFRPSWVAGSPARALLRSLMTRMALCEALAVRGADAAALAAVIAALNALNILLVATVTFEGHAVAGSVFSAHAAVWPPAIADFGRPNLESLAVVISTSACSHLSSLANGCEAATLHASN